MVIMDYCKSIKLVLGLSVQFLVWRTAAVASTDAEIGEIHFLLFLSVFRLINI